jgi:DNA-directed RNA polymerase subunit M/transcription elongation factor TFIIS
MFVVTRTDMVDYHRRYALDPLIKTKQQLQFIEILKNRVRATVEEACPECKHPQMEYYTMQLRSADEGQVRAGGRLEGVWRQGAGQLATAGAVCLLRVSHKLPLCLWCVPSSPLLPFPLQTVFYECRNCRHRHSTNN